MAEKRSFARPIEVNGNFNVTGTSTLTGAVTMSGGASITGSVTGTYTLAGTPTFTSPTINTPTVTSLGYTDLTETVAATNVLTAAESGKVCFLSAATEFVSTLPAPAAGLHFTFIVAAAPSGASYTVVTASSANIIIGQQYNAAGAAGDTGTTDDTITFVDGQSVVGDRVEVYCDGTNWFAYAFCAVAAGITFTTAS